MFKAVIRVFILLLLSASADLCFAITYPVDAVYDSVRNRYLISNQFGTIDQIDSNGTVTLFTAVASPQIEALLIYNDTLFVTGNNLIAINLETGQQLYNMTLPDQSGLRDMALDTSGNLYITDLFANLIFKLKLSDLSVSLLSIDFISPNGLCFDAKNNRLLVVQRLEDSPITAINLTDNSYTVLRGAIGELNIPNGIVQDNGGNFYVAEGPRGRILRYDKFFSKPPVVYASGLGYPVYIYYCWQKEEIVVPEFNVSRVSFLATHGPEIDEIGVTDGLSGDMDGIPEGGETGEFYFTLINSRIDSLKNIQVGLSVDDASLCLINRTISMDNMAVGDSSRNESNPFLFAIPDGYIPRTDTFLLEVSYQYRGSYVTDTIRVGQNIGQVSILLVDNDGGTGVNVDYQNCLGAKRIPFDILNASQVNSVDSLSPYEIVIWFTGGLRSNPVDTSKLAYIQTYLDNGGKLFMTGVAIAPQLNSQGRVDFLNNYLHCNYNSTLTVPMLNGISGGQVFSLADTIAAVVTSPDHIMPTNGGVGELTYYKKTTLGAVSYSGTYKMVFFSFNFEAIADYVPHRITRDSVLTEILNFFGYNFPQILMTLTVTPGNPMHLVSHVPAIEWNYLTSGYSQQNYHLQIGTDNDWTVSEMWDYGPINGSETSVIYGGSELQDGQSYSYRLQVSDGTTSSAWQYGVMRLNTPPTVPTGLAPHSLQIFPAITPDLSCINATDNENDIKTYSFEVYDDEGLTVPVVNADNQAEGVSGTTIWKITPALATGNDYYWRVRTTDGFEYSSWSEPASFMIDAGYVCGDANDDTKVNLLDVSFIIADLYRGGPSPNHPNAADVNGDGKENLLDVSYIINRIYRGGPPYNCP